MKYQYVVLKVEPEYADAWDTDIIEVTPSLSVAKKVAADIMKDWLYEVTYDAREQDWCYRLPDAEFGVRIVKVRVK